jgi:hypothetical protein
MYKFGHAIALTLVWIALIAMFAFYAFMALDIVFGWTTPTP